MSGSTSTASSNVAIVPYVVRQNLLPFVALASSGLLLIGAPLLVGFVDPVWVQMLSVAIGLICSLAAYFGYRVAVVGVRLDVEGIWVSGFSSGQLKLIPWDAIAGVRKITYADPEGEQDGVLVGINTPDCYPFGEEHAERGKQELSRLIGPIEFPCAVLLNHDEWDWDIDEFLNLAQQCLNDHGGGYQPSSLES